MVDYLNNDFSLKKREKIREKAEFERIFAHGKRLGNEYFKIIVHTNQVNYTRLAIIIGRRFGKAYIRNKIKRRIREIYRLNKRDFSSSKDYLILPKTEVNNLSFNLLNDKLLKLVEKTI